MFQKTVNGVKDPKINREGRPIKESTKKPTNRELKERELLMLLRKIRPHVADSIMAAAKIMKNEEAAHQNTLKACTILIDAYRKLTLDLYDGEAPDEEGTEIQEQNKPVFSLKVIGTESNEEVKE